jgi:hypothetical protein
MKINLNWTVEDVVQLLGRMCVRCGALAWYTLVRVDTAAPSNF